MDRQTVEHWTDILIDDWQMDRLTDGLRDRIPWSDGLHRGLEILWVFQLFFLFLGVLPGLILCSRITGVLPIGLSPLLYKLRNRLQQQNKSNLHTAINLQKFIILSIYLPLATLDVLYLRRATTAQVYVDILLFSVVKQSLVIHSNLLHNILSKLYFDRFCAKQNDGFWDFKNDNGV